MKPKKYATEQIEEARKRLDKSSRGSDEEYYKNLLMNFDNIKKKQTVGLNALKEYFDMLWDSYVMENNENLTEGAKDLKLEVLRCVLYLVEYPYKTQ